MISERVRLKLCCFLSSQEKNFSGRNLTLVGRYFVKCAISGLRVRILLAEMLFSVERWFWGVCATGGGVLEMFLDFSIWCCESCELANCALSVPVLLPELPKKVSKCSLLKFFFNYYQSKHYRWPACLGYIHAKGLYS